MSDSDTGSSRCGSQSSRDEQNCTDASESRRWQYVDETHVELRIDDVDQFLLDKARVESTQVVERLMTRMYGTKRCAPSDAPVLDIMRAWLDPTVLTVATQHINANLDADAFLTRAELLEFLHVELWLSFYAVSPNKFYDPKNRKLYPPVASTVKSTRYFQVLNALGTQSGRAPASSEVWTAPFEHDRRLGHAMDALRRVCSEIGFINEVSIASLDDDLLRLRSSSVDDIGLTRTRNPVKGFGPVQHGIVSLVTGLFLGGHIASRGESVVDVMKILQRSLCGVTTDSQIRLPGVIFALDRGYQSKEVNQQILNCGGAIIGTHKRTSAFPFTYGKPGNRSQKTISEKGAKSAQWASSRFSMRTASGTTSAAINALAYRCGLGKVVLCSTSVDATGPGNWSYVVNTRSGNTQGAADVGSFAEFEEHVKLLTAQQGTPDWFLMRRFRITGLVAISILRSIANIPPPDEARGEVDNAWAEYYELSTRTAVQFVSQLLRIKIRVVREEAAEESDVERFTASTLDKMKNKVLQQMCKDRNLAAYGNKSDLVSRLLAAQNTPTASKNASGFETPIMALLKAWFLSPQSSTDMKIGSKNENNVCSRLPAFLSAHSSFNVDSTKSYGLLCRSQQEYLAFSPDGIASVTSPDTERRFVVFEYKTRTKANTIDIEKSLAKKWGRFATITLTATADGGKLKDLIPDQGHRSQVLHNIVCSGQRDTFLVYASPTSILRVVHVGVGEDVVEAYLLAFAKVHDVCLDWVYMPGTPVPSFSETELGYCGEMATLKQHLNLWCALVALVDERGQPLPPAKHIIPAAVATWNRVKGGIDVYSRYLKNVRARHLHLPSLGAIWLRFFMTLIYNAYQSTQLLRGYDALMDEQCQSYSSYQHQRCLNSSLSDFYRDAALCLPALFEARDEPPIVPAVESDFNSTDEVLGTVRPEPQSFGYRKREIFEKKPEWRKLRLTKREGRVEKLIEGAKQLSCILCCQLNHDKENATQHSRKRYKTRYQCSICEVALCRQPHWENGETCFDRFHSASHLGGSCDPSTEHPKHVRPPPPSRKRSSLSIEQNERRVTRLVAKTRRQSARLMLQGA